MAANSFGTLFRVTTWGESHGPAIGCVVDGCPAGLSLSEEDIQKKLDLRRPGRNLLISERKEEDRVEILSGVFEGKTTGCPISLFIRNKDADSSEYEEVKKVLRPGHANFTYVQKYGIFDFRGGGRASARETACRVAAGAIAEKLLQHAGVKIVTYLSALGSVQSVLAVDDIHPKMIQNIQLSPLFCVSQEDETRMKAYLEEIKEASDSIGGVVTCIAFHVPPGLGDPVYEKIQAKLGGAMMSIPACKAFEIGEGMHASSMRGSEHNDSFIQKDGKIKLQTNHSGGVLGGITTGEPLIVRMHFKPTSSIQKEQSTVDCDGNPTTLHFKKTARHDPSLVIRAVPVCEAMCALVLADAFLMNRLSKLS